MATQDKEHAGSGLDKPDPKTLLETVVDKLKEIVPSKPSPAAPRQPGSNPGQGKNAPKTAG